VVLEKVQTFIKVNHKPDLLNLSCKRAGPYKILSDPLYKASYLLDITMKKETMRPFTRLSKSGTR